MIKVLTTKKHRFNKSIVISGQVIQIDASGYASVSEDIVSQALIAGFELVDKDAKFPTEEQKQHVAEVNAILESAKAQAAGIIAEAEQKAKEIIAEAELKAGKISQEGQADEREAKKAELAAKKVDELKALCADVKIPEEQWEHLKKAELVDLLMSFIFDEGK